MSAAGTVLSQPTRQTSASKSCAWTISSIESAITSREISDARIPGVPCDWLSETAIVLNGSATPPAAVDRRRAASASSRWLRLHGIVPVHVEAMPTIGPPSRAGRCPSRGSAPGRRRARGRRAGPRVRLRRSSPTARTLAAFVQRKRGLACRADSLERLAIALGGRRDGDPVAGIPAARQSPAPRRTGTRRPAAAAPSATSSSASGTWTGRPDSLATVRCHTLPRAPPPTSTIGGVGIEARALARRAGRAPRPATRPRPRRRRAGSRSRVVSWRRPATMPAARGRFGVRSPSRYGSTTTAVRSRRGVAVEAEPARHPVDRERGVQRGGERQEAAAGVREPRHRAGGVRGRCSITA